MESTDKMLAIFITCIAIVVTLAIISTQCYYYMLATSMADKGFEEVSIIGHSTTVFQKVRN